jgi:uncharacterized SAM-binding protein YcdF (DUF218 family)
LNNFLILLGIESWKPLLTTLVLPPVPLLVLLLIGARLLLPRRGLGWLIVLLSVALLWLSACMGVSRALTQFVLRPPPALNAARVAELKSLVQGKQPLAIVVLGAGMQPFAPEYGVSNLSPDSVERLRYGVWLSRETGAPLAFVGGVGWAQAGGTPEAQVASRIALREFGRPLQWTEEQSRDTRENAARGVALLKQAGVNHVLLVTHAFHMPRAKRAFEEAAAGAVLIEPAVLGMGALSVSPSLTWVPTAEGATQVRLILRELLGRALGA